MIQTQSGSGTVAVGSGEKFPVTYVVVIERYESGRAGIRSGHLVADDLLQQKKLYDASSLLLDDGRKSDIMAINDEGDIKGQGYLHGPGEPTRGAYDDMLGR